MKIILLNVLGFLIFLIRLVFLFAEVVALWFAEAADWCDNRCLDTLKLLDPTKGDKE